MAQDPPQEQLNPFIERCMPEPRVVNVLLEGTNEIHQVEVFVAGMTFQRAYMVPDIREPTAINHGGPDWGAVSYGYTLERIQGYEPPVFLFPSDASERIDVAIKRLDKRIFEPLLAQNRENPYREIHRMQTPSLTDGGYVHPLVEALEDDHYLYIITPFADGGDLTESIPLQPQENMPVELQAYQVYKQMLDAVNHIHNNPHIRGQFGIGHRDIKGGNFFVSQGRIRLADFAMSYPIPPGDLVNHMGGFGTPAYLPPEIAREGEFSATGCDLWACTVTLFNLVTGMPVYMMPIPTDIFFVYNIMARGLSNDPNGEMVEALFDEADGRGRHALQEMWQRIQGLSPQLRDLLSNVLELAPGQRWNMQDVQNSAWMQLSAALLGA
ncbi:unnamed protein product [Cylindrotheca closterium]|uniref:Protein kinase domain-containing protein n=1 Tax=Cylindrotheca closterium TaxID=2856 RepID=A0AAD2FV86_9STRA|nr:unnamed protein product [Cylindrotheca closterium]